MFVFLMTLVQEYVVNCCSKMFLTVLSEMIVINEGCFFIKTRLMVLAVFENAGEDWSLYLLIIKSLIFLIRFLFMIIVFFVFFFFFFTIPSPVVNSSMFYILLQCVFSPLSFDGRFI